MHWVRLNRGVPWILQPLPSCHIALLPLRFQHTFLQLVRGDLRHLQLDCCRSYWTSETLFSSSLTRRHEQLHAPWFGNCFFIWPMQNIFASEHTDCDESTVSRTTLSLCLSVPHIACTALDRAAILVLREERVRGTLYRCESPTPRAPKVGMTHMASSKCTSSCTIFSSYARDS